MELNMGTVILEPFPRPSANFLEFSPSDGSFRFLFEKTFISFILLVTEIHVKFLQGEIKGRIRKINVIVHKTTKY